MLACCCGVSLFHFSNMLSSSSLFTSNLAILNLLSNGIKYSEAGSTINVIISHAQKEISCCVIDEGVGISTEGLPHLFEMFRKANGAVVERKQGVGLGLAFVDAVAKRHSGYVDVVSNEGEGSSFCLKLPKVAPVEPVE